VLLLDESTSGLDGQTRDQLVDNILALFDKRVVVFASHDKDLVSRVDSVISLAAGELAPGAEEPDSSPERART
jgi:ABC-type bacteriocin/lantibiotic exporter with double-glycine peptidase domain